MREGCSLRRRRRYPGCRWKTGSNSYAVPVSPTLDQHRTQLTYTPNPPEVGGEVKVDRATYSYNWITPVGLVPGLGSGITLHPQQPPCGWRPTTSPRDTLLMLRTALRGSWSEREDGQVVVICRSHVRRFLLIILRDRTGVRFHLDAAAQSADLSGRGGAGRRARARRDQRNSKASQPFPSPRAMQRRTLAILNANDATVEDNYRAVRAEVSKNASTIFGSWFGFGGMEISAHAVARIASQNLPGKGVVPIGVQQSDYHPDDGALVELKDKKMDGVTSNAGFINLIGDTGDQSPRRPEVWLGCAAHTDHQHRARQQTRPGHSEQQQRSPRPHSASIGAQSTVLFVERCPTAVRPDRCLGVQPFHRPRSQTESRQQP